MDSLFEHDDEKKLTKIMLMLSLAAFVCMRSTSEPTSEVPKPPGVLVLRYDDVNPLRLIGAPCFCVYCDEEGTPEGSCGDEGETDIALPLAYAPALFPSVAEVKRPPMFLFVGAPLDN